MAAGECKTIKTIPTLYSHIKSAINDASEKQSSMVLLNHGNTISRIVNSIIL